jgi:cell division protein FtsB
VAGDATGLRRPRVVLIASLLIAAAILFAWFPASSLLHQRANLGATQSELAALHAQDAALGQEQKSLNDLGEIGRIAREQYQLVSPGQSAYEVLPPSGAAPPGTVYSGDPGLDGPVTPSATPELLPGGVTTTTTTTIVDGHASTSRPAKASTAPGGLVSRMVHTLEFWR